LRGQLLLFLPSFLHDRYFFLRSEKLLVVVTSSNIGCHMVTLHV